MKFTFKNITLIAFTSVLMISCNTSEHKTDEIQTEEAPKIDIEDETEAVKTVLKSYKDAIEKLTTEGTKELFTENATVFESGGSEGTYQEYESHHLAPELEFFSLFEFSDYSIDVEMDFPYAFTTESYNYTIEIPENIEEYVEARTIKQTGVATSILKNIDGVWKITKTHSSSRAFNAGHH